MATSLQKLTQTLTDSDVDKLAALPSAAVDLIATGAKATCSVTLVAFGTWADGLTIAVPGVAAKTIKMTAAGDIDVSGAADIAAAAAIIGAYMAAAGGSLVDYVGTVGQVMTFRAKTEGTTINAEAVTGTLLTVSATFNGGVSPMSADTPLGWVNRSTKEQFRFQGSEGVTPGDQPIAPVDFVRYRAYWSGSREDAWGWRYNKDGAMADQPICWEMLETNYYYEHTPGVFRTVTEFWYSYTSIDRLTTYRPWIIAIDQATNYASTAWTNVDEYVWNSPGYVNQLKYTGTTGLLTLDSIGDMAMFRSSYNTAGAGSGVYVLSTVTPNIGNSRGIFFGFKNGSGAQHYSLASIQAKATAVTASDVSTDMIFTAYKGSIFLGAEGGYANVLVGCDSLTVDATARRCLVLTNAAVAPAASADRCHLYCADAAAGHATLAIWAEEVVAAIGVKTVTEYFPILIGGVVKNVALVA